MDRNVFFLVCISLLAYGLSAQPKIDFGKLSQNEKDFKVFKKDTTAVAVFLYEYGDNYFEVRNNFIWLITEYHAKIKILKEEGFRKANIEIPYYRGENSSEKVQKIRAITHNGTVKVSLRPTEVFDVDVSERWSQKRFAFPNVKVGSVLEYTYEIQSPFHFNLNGWDFQSDIPKVYTEYNARIPGNWVYNRSLIGELKLDINKATLKKNCFSIPAVSKNADCEALKYVMKDVPAFYESEEFMLSGNNYRSRLDFELSEYQNLRGGTEKYTKSWQDVDREFKKDQDIGRQLRKKNFFEKKVPSELITEGSKMERAKNIYAFVQNHFVWNKKFGLWQDNRVKQAFDNQIGNVAEINITLINLLNAAGINSNMVLLATRERGLPKKNHPVMSDFNYIISKTEIDGQEYLLDATDKLMPFGMLPFRCLNYYGRVMDFDKASYWQNIEVEKKNKHVIRAKMELYPGQGNAIGTLVWTSMGYSFLNQKRATHNIAQEEYLNQIEEDFGDDFYITSYTLGDKFSDGRRMTEKFEFEIENMVQDGNIYLNPFLVKFFASNPFKASERHYPIDFGYLRNNAYSLSVKIPKGYKLKSLPEKKLIVLPGNAGLFRFECQEAANGILTVIFDFKLSYTQYRSDAYQTIKQFFQQVVEAQTQSYIVLEKV
ncbi:DUF3857 domain-containing protein [Allomuricauda sp. SCSIO 65647]|uniref:DUF3857 domain-containing protein n=1 Tax=Allomuricauda sp. SCSIO 65647 TaxID=2908843 RepID=UPI001F2DAD94|nr:DUF3857 domain-containing protein [Muricauda sp. SCSIO 65647]UJH68229.1 DUF3857 domain-containing protein [Muricauda sp. SCSIO 65647]